MFYLRFNLINGAERVSNVGILEFEIEMNQCMQANVSIM